MLMGSRRRARGLGLRGGEGVSMTSWVHAAIHMVRSFAASFLHYVWTALIIWLSTVNLLMGGEQFDFHCHSNLTRAVLPHGLTELDVHDVLNVFQVTGLDENAKYFMETSPAKPGEYFEFFAEVDVLCALSACPGGLSINLVALIYPPTCANCCFNRRPFELGLGSKGGCYGCYHAPPGSGSL